MERINRLLEYVQKTNSTMTKDKLIEELSKSQYSAIALIMVCENENLLQNKKSMVY